MEKILSTRLHEALQSFKDMESSLGFLTTIVQQQIVSLEESLKGQEVADVEF